MNDLPLKIFIENDGSKPIFLFKPKALLFVMIIYDEILFNLETQSDINPKEIRKNKKKKLDHLYHFI